MAWTRQSAIGALFEVKRPGSNLRVFRRNPFRVDVHPIQSHNQGSRKVTQPESVVQLVKSIESELGPIEILVLNATGPEPDAPIDGVVGRSSPAVGLLREKPCSVGPTCHLHHADPAV